VTSCEFSHAYPGSRRILLLFSSPAVAAETIGGTTSVIDSDTLEVQGKRIRLHGVDAPESAQLSARMPPARIGAAVSGRRWPCPTGSPGGRCHAR
jgi:endonuclease YncB( thermonuclease family)